MGFGYHGKILEIDLSKGSIQVKPLDSEDVEDFLGGRGLATRLFFCAVDPACDPLGPDNAVVIAASPLLGSAAPAACRGHMVFKSPLTGALGSSNCGGTWAPAFKAAGFDALIIRGKASEPVLIDISPGKAEIIPAKEIWGLDVHRTTDILNEKGGSRNGQQILCIGPAGENLVLFSSVLNDKNRAYGRGGPAAVWGSKNLKAIRVFGNLRIQVKDKGLFQSGVDQAQYLLKAVPATKRLLRDLGTPGMVKLIHLIGMLPHRNFEDASHRDEDVEKISGETLSRTLLQKAGACHGCPISCRRHTRVGEKRGEGPEYETEAMMGPNCDIYELESITRANYLCNELGLDTISFGGTLACAMELYEKKILTVEDTGGIELCFGNAEILEKIVELVAFRKGFGNRLAGGSFRLASHFGHPELSMTVKKLEIPGYDPRASYVQALAYMTSSTGACHLRGGNAASLEFLGGAREIPRFSLLQAALSLRNIQNLGIVQDSLGICRFTGPAVSLELWSPIVSGATGVRFSTAKLGEIADRIASLERLFNLKAGFSGEDDLLPERFSSEPILVEGKERLISRETMERLRKGYYEVRGWDSRGKPMHSNPSGQHFTNRRRRGN